MNQNNVISAAQARLNFCDNDYVNLMKEINEQITEKSRSTTFIRILSDDPIMVRNKVVADLKDNGFDVTMFHHHDTTFTISISW